MAPPTMTYWEKRILLLLVVLALLQGVFDGITWSKWTKQRDWANKVSEWAIHVQRTHLEGPVDHIPEPPPPPAW